MQRSRATRPNLKKFQKMFILECSSGKLHIPLHPQMCQVALESPYFYLLLQPESKTLLSDFAVTFLAFFNNIFYT